jgi:hypothetical protein
MNNQFRGFSESSSGSITLQVSDLDTGLYALTVSPAQDSTNIIQTYNFRVQ